MLVPAGLRDQWRDELLARAGIVADVVDAAALATAAMVRPRGRIPWAGPRASSIVSLDFAKQPTVLAGLLASPWDVLVVDEAHMASGESARAAAVSRIAAISRVVRCHHRDAALGRPARLPLAPRTRRRHGADALVPARTAPGRPRCRQADAVVAHPSIAGRNADARRARTLRAPRGTAGGRRRTPGDDRASQASAVERRRAGMQPAPAPRAARRRSGGADPSAIRAQPWRSGHRRLRRREAAGGARAWRIERAS